ncbi:MAG: class IV adenylate cyclase [Solirubrobacteraceae bacterium]
MPPAILDPRRNIELKARDDDPDWSLGVCRILGAEDHGTIQQRDSYFDVRRGGLKLREERPGSVHLIQFERADEPQQRESRYRIAGIEDGPQLRAVLQAALGVRVLVAKRRRLHIWRDVRIHLDEVDRLGTFIELEAVAAPESDLTREHALLEELRAAFAISDDRLVSRGYAAQLLE